jgi:radical SAM family uncharacterized protein/radical SAM-linked protein
MSHLGMKILYDIINRLPYAAAERIFAPWTDLEAYLKESGALLSSLESNIPIKKFDVVGFSMQYELSYTTVLNMLHLGGIPHRAEGRFNAKEKMPIIVAGGPCTANPAPMAAFIDVFLIGDGEAAIVELVDAVRRWKLNGDGRRETILKMIAGLEGFYVPSVHKPGDVIKRRFVPDLDSAPYPVKPVVPYTAIVHDRINIEVSRGCAMGCRFCHAGMVYRPLRERSPETVLYIAEESIKNTGYDEVSFTSLSAGDYTYLLPAIREFNKRFGRSKIALSLPSLRVGAVNRDVLKEIRSVRKTGFTMAPEAATERLRRVINKDFSDEDYERALNVLSEEGWQAIKLYFMIGLPTETDEDIEAIKEMALKALRIAKKNTGRFVNIGITVSPFVPKPHTPFQWCGQNIEDIRRKQKYLREALSSKKFKYKGHDDDMSFLEAVFSRGDERLSLLIEKAWELGCRLDGWSEMFDFDKWLDAMNKTGIDGLSYAEKKFEKNEPFPWDNIATGIKKDFLFKEYERAMNSEKTQDCRKSCSACGLKCKSSDELRVMSDESKERSGSPPLAARSASPKIRIRVRFSKTGALSCLSHLELVTAVLRGLRRAGVPFDFSKGFHPAPMVSFGPPLNTGIAGEREYFDMEVFGPFDIEFYMKGLSEAMPEGIGIHKMAVIPMNEPSLTGFVKRYEYLIKGCGQRAAGGKNMIVSRDGKDIDLSQCIEDITIAGDDARLILKDTDAVKVRMAEIAGALFGIKIGDANIIRKALYGLKENAEENANEKGWTEPL